MRNLFVQQELSLMDWRVFMEAVEGQVRKARWPVLA